ncbi:unnamed protein product [Anisakis simplex]|uniref:Uncharacterized protein n=1 Tax=Anisakis simplex TaxID=6269 RepID=A0A3P6PNN7_ANISI|nr:unnamed protein product [Anisakis simplex]
MKEMQRRDMEEAERRAAGAQRGSVGKQATPARERVPLEGTAATSMERVGPETSDGPVEPSKSKIFKLDPLEISLSFLLS